MSKNNIFILVFVIFVFTLIINVIIVYYGLTKAEGVTKLCFN